MDPRGEPLATVLGCLAGNFKPPSAGDSGPAGRGKRAHDRAPAGDTIRRSVGTCGTLGHLREIRSSTGRKFMTRVQLEHLIRAAGTIANVDDVVVIGSQAVLGEFPDAPAEFLISDSDLIDSTIGEGSPFQREFGCYAHGVDETTAILPQGWRDRLILVTGQNTRFVRGWWLEIHYLAIAKYAAGREKDLAFTKALARHAMVRREVLEQRLACTLLDPQVRSIIYNRIQADFDAPGRAA